MSRKRQSFLRLVATYCKNHTNISVWDAVAYFAAKSLKAGSTAKEEASEVIAFIKSTDPEYFEDEYSKVMQDRWDNDGDSSPHYYCSLICPEFEKVGV